MKANRNNLIETVNAIIKPYWEWKNCSYGSKKLASWLERLLEDLLKGMAKHISVAEKHLFIDQVNFVLRRRCHDQMKLAVRYYFCQYLKRWCDGNRNHFERIALEARLTQFNSFGWISLYRGSIRDAIFVVIKSKVVSELAGEFQEKRLHVVRAWVDKLLTPCLATVFAAARLGDDEDLFVGLSSMLEEALNDGIIKQRATELFEMVTEHPDSIPAWEELQAACQSSEGNLEYLGKNCRETICRRLLHPGAATTVILDMYVSLIRCLRIIDSSDRLLNFVAAPIRAYLKARKDTVRCVVSSLTESKESDLHVELRKGGSLEYGQDEDDEEGGPGEHWMPTKKDPWMSNAGIRGLDVLALLVSIYGSTTLFVAEYRQLLAEKLLVNLAYNTDEEVATLELLKLRFGEEPLHNCEIMLRDLEESKRCNNAVHQAQQKKSPRLSVLVDCVIVSDNYWPANVLSELGESGGINENTGNQLTQHPVVEQELQSYRDCYSTLKKPRKLNVSATLGVVELELAFEDGSTREFAVSPMQANLILYCGHSPNPLSVPELSNMSGLCEADVIQFMSFWLTKSVVKSSKSPNSGEIVYEIVEEQSEIAQNESRSDNTVEGVQVLTFGSSGGGVGATGENQALETFIKGMLANQGSMTVERLHTMLNLISSSQDSSHGFHYALNVVELRRYLQGLVDQASLDCIDGMYMNHSG